MSKIEVRPNVKGFDRIQVTLENGEQSPMFEAYCKSGNSEPITLDLK